MSYNPSIPIGNTRINQTYNNITTNFTVLNNVFAKDHYEWNYATVADQGLHRKVSLLQQAAAPAAGTLRGFVYTINNSANVTRTDPYFRWDTGGGAGTASMNGAIAPVIPFKAFCQFTPAGVVSNAFNVANVVAFAPTIYFVNFTNKLSNDPAATIIRYLVLATAEIAPSPPPALPTILVNAVNTNNSSVEIHTSSNAFTTISMGVIQY